MCCLETWGPALSSDLPPTPSQRKTRRNFIQQPKTICTRTYGPVKFNCGHVKEISTVIACDKNCGAIKDSPVGMSTRRGQACSDCKAKK
ncbi:hypothetical protein Pdw03_6121 [Penicillium digitatum]|uniref:Uncharacterized protein n=1 Tax=Penicillium digitatum TaxID=36651 RepID=A0A7T6XJB6_PENDI|nr:hypothetical protein Pdw03_6121 [Penicillium digitatum]